MNVKELKHYLECLPNDAEVVIKDTEGQFIIEDISLNSVPCISFDTDTCTSKKDKQLQFEIFVGK